MPLTQILVTAMTHMKAGICTAGFTGFRAGEQPRWVRPVLKFGEVQREMMTTAQGYFVQPGVVVELNCQKPAPAPPQVENWLTDYCNPRVRVVETLDSAAFGQFLAANSDPNCDEVLGPSPKRSLCLVPPDEVHATFIRKQGQYSARLCYRQGQLWRPGPPGMDSWPVTDLRWRAFGEESIAKYVPSTAQNAACELSYTELLAAWNADTVFLSLGLSKPFQNRNWVLVIGVFPVRCPG